MERREKVEEKKEEEEVRTSEIVVHCESYSSLHVESLPVEDCEEEM